MSNESDDTTRKEEFVITPGGPRPKDHVHSVGPGDVVSIDDEGNAVVIPRKEVSAKTEERSTNMAQNLVLTPGGFRHPSLVHRVESGHALHLADGRMQMMKLSTKALIDIPEVTVRPEEVPALGSGWISYAYWNNGTGNSISSFRTTWQVPPAPATQSNQVIFLFNGIQNYGNNYGILQPVLQWGQSAAGGGSYWSVASWYVTSSGQAFYTSPVRVNAGDTLVGVMTLTGQSGSSFNYNCEFQGIAGTSLPVQNIAELLWCNETLEAYGVNRSSDYPAIDHTGLQVINIRTGSTTPTLNWTPVNRVTDTGQHAVVVSNSATEGEVDIYYSRSNIFQMWNNNNRLGMIVYSLQSGGGYGPSFASSDMGQGSGAVAWLVSDNDVFQMWNNNNRLGMIVYSPQPAGGYGTSFASSNMGQGSGAVAWLAGDSSVFQMWNNNGRLGMIIYSPQPGGGYGTSFASNDMGQGSGAVAWLAGDTNGDGRTDIIQMWNNNGRLGMIVYSPQQAGGYGTSFASSDMGQGSGAVAWLARGSEVFQMWNNNGRLGMIVYSPQPGGYGTSFASSNMGQGSGAVAWLAGDTNGDGKTDIIQMWNNNGRLGMIVYSPQPAGGYGTSFASSDMGQGSGAVAWLAGDINGDGKTDIIQMWNNNGRLGMIVYSQQPGGGYGTSFASSDMGQGSGAVAWLVG